jgi:transposase
MQDIMTRESIAEVYRQGLEAVVGLVEQLLEQVTALTGRVKELEQQRALDSHNSSKPPSTDQRGSKPAPKSLRQRSGRKSGGQPGHTGATLALSGAPDRVVVHAPERCVGCGASLAEAPTVAVERRQVIDLPPELVEVIEHQVETRRCPCGTTARGSFPDGVAASVQYGAGLKALAVYLNQQQLIPTARTAEILADVFGCASFSEGTLGTAVEECYAGLEGVESAVQAGVRQAAVAHFDETGLNIGGTLHWLHVASTPHLTHYAWHQKRGAAAADEIGILPGFTGTGVHDGLTSYWRYGWAHALCNAHHLRELTFVEERLGQAWARDMKTLLGEIKQAVDAARSGGAADVPADRQQAFVVRYRSILTAGYEANPPPERPVGQRGRPKRGKVLSLLDRLRDHEEATLAFMRDFAVPFDNNQAERDLRMVKVQQKVSGCFRQPQGAARFCRIRGYLSTARKQGQRALSCIEGVFRGHPFLPDVQSGVAGG